MNTEQLNETPDGVEVSCADYEVLQSSGRLVTSIASMTLNGECPACMEDGSKPNPECGKDHGKFQMTAQDAMETLSTLIATARRIAKGTSSAPTLEQILVPFALPVRVAKHPVGNDVFPWTIVDANGMYVIGVYQQDAADQLVLLLNKVARANPSATALFSNNQIHQLFAGIIRQHFPWVAEEEGKLAPGAEKIKDLYIEMRKGEDPCTVESLRKL